MLNRRKNLPDGKEGGGESLSLLANEVIQLGSQAFEDRFDPRRTSTTSTFHQIDQIPDTSHSAHLNLSGFDDYHKQTNDFLYYDVQPGDTLHNISVRYSCPLASIKRLNNLFSEQEFFGLTKLKLPVGKLRLLANVIDDSSDNFVKSIDDQCISTVKQPESYISNDINLGNRKSTSYLDSGIASSPIRKEFHNYTVDLNPDIRPAHSENDILHDVDKKIEEIRKAAKSYTAKTKELYDSLAQSGNIVDYDDSTSRINLLARHQVETLLNDMTDNGLSYSGLVLFVFIVCLICPLAYVIYLEERSE